MKEVTGIKSNIKPEEIDDTSSDTTVFMRYNIEEITETDPVFGTEETVYVYDETQYTLAEWYRIRISELNAEINNLKETMKVFADELGVSIEL